MPAILVTVELYTRHPSPDGLSRLRPARPPAPDAHPVPTGGAVADSQMYHLEQHVAAAAWRHHHAAARQVGRVVVGEVRRGDVRV